MQRVTRQKQFAFEFRRPAGLNEFQIKIFIRTVDFIADDRMTERSEMNTNLMSPSRFRNRADKREFFSRRRSSVEALFDTKFCDCRGALGMNHLLQPDRRRLLRALAKQGSIDNFRLPARPAPDDGEIFLVDALLLHEQTKSSRGGSCFCNEDKSAGLAVQSIDD